MSILIVTLVALCSFDFHLVNAYGRNGMGAEAVDIYRQMPEVMRNRVSHVCVLNACSHAGLIDEARSIFNNIETKTVQIITVMVCVIVHDQEEYVVVFLNTNDLDRLFQSYVHVRSSTETHG